MVWMELLKYWWIVLIVVLVLVVLFTSYVKAPPDVAYVISGLRKEPKVLIGRAGIKLPFFERKDELLVKQISIDIKTDDFVPTLDLMILDKAPTSLFHRKIKNIALGFVQGMIKSRPNYSRFNLKNKFFSFVSYQMGKLLSDYYKINLYHKIAKTYGDKCSPYSSCYFEPYNDIGIIHRADALHKIERHQFEDTQVSILSCWDEYLKELYGDYMTPPKETERIPIHIK